MSDEKPSWQKDDEEEEEDIDESQYIQTKDAILFAIDVSKSMLTRPPLSESKKSENDSPTAAAIKCAYQIMQQRIISSPRDMMGVLLFGTEKSKFQDEDGTARTTIAYPHCYLLNDLNVPSAENVKALRAVIEDEDEANDLLQIADTPVSMSNLLFCANQIFTTRAPNFGSRRLFIITDNDDPHTTDKNLRSQATVRAKDLYDLGVVIELFPISHPEHEFDRTKFYDDIIYRDPTDGDDLALAPATFKTSGGEGISLLANLISDINSKQVAKRTLFSNMPLEIGPNLRISVKGYNLLQKQAPARSCYVWQGGETAQIAVGETSLFNDETNVVEKTQIKKAYKFAGTQILFTPEEQKELKSWGSPVIRIIGFKPVSMLPTWASVKKSTFIYPSEESFVGSTRVFSALWQKLLKDKIMGVAWYVARSNATPVLAAILPSAERFDDLTSGQIIPAGLWLYQLPFADDIRSMPEVSKPIVAPDKLVDQMRVIIQQLQLPKGIYDPSKYPNPALQWHYKILQAMALDDEIPDQPEDKTLPKSRQIEKRAGEYIQQWGVTLDEQVRAHQKSTYGGIDGTTLKRGTDDDEEEKPKKRIKTEKSNLSSLSTDELKSMVVKGTLNKHTVAELKDLLSSKGITALGKKQDLIDRVEQWVEDH